jgi:hypothetical protein
VSRPAYSWSKVEAGQWQLVLELCGFDYATVSDLCEAVGLPRPSAMPESRRAKLLERLLAPEGRALYARVAAAREQLENAAAELGHKARRQAAERADLRDRRGRTITAPGSMTGRELWTLLAHVETAPVVLARVECDGCGITCAGGYLTRCPVCGCASFRAAA